MLINNKKKNNCMSVEIWVCHMQHNVVAVNLYLSQRVFSDNFNKAFKVNEIEISDEDLNKKYTKKNNKSLGIKRKSSILLVSLLLVNVCINCL